MIAWSVFSCSVAGQSQASCAAAHETSNPCLSAMASTKVAQHCADAFDTTRRGRPRLARSPAASVCTRMRRTALSPASTILALDSHGKVADSTSLQRRGVDMRPSHVRPPPTRSAGSPGGGLQHFALQAGTPMQASQLANPQCPLAEVVLVLQLDHLPCVPLAWKRLCRSVHS